MTWVALVGPEIEENLSLRYLASSLEAAGVRCEILPFHVEEHFAAVVERVLCDDPPALVGLSLSFQWRALDMLAVAMALKNGGYRGHITAGGHFATFAAKEMLENFAELDSICRQEAEVTIVELVAAVVEGRPIHAIPGVACRVEGGSAVSPSSRGATSAGGAGADGASTSGHGASSHGAASGDHASADVDATVASGGAGIGSAMRISLGDHPRLPDLAKLPRPDRRGEPARCFGHGLSPLVGSRGCYANCTFCCIAAWHEQTLPGKRYRVREPEDVAAEMIAMQRERDIEIFVFHDDNFFLPSKQANLDRFNALADALERGGMGKFATVVKARPTDVHEDLFRVLRDRLQCIRCYVGVETDSEQGLVTLRRWAKPRQNHDAIDVVRALDLYTCFNLLVFDPDTTLDTLETNISFMEWARELPFNFGRVELYAGTPLLHRMQMEGRARGDWLQHDYDLHDEKIDRVFKLALAAFNARNFAAGALNNHIMGLRFDIEVARHFHDDVFRPAWLAEGKALCAALAGDTVRGLRSVVDHVKTTAPSTTKDKAFVRELSVGLRATEKDIWAKCRALAGEMLAHIGQGQPLTEIGDVVATPLQRARAFVEAG